MIDDKRYEEWLAAYKRDFNDQHWSNEGYKWEAVKTFQDNFDINAPNLRAMLEASLAKCDVLLTGANRFPAGMLCGFAEAYPDRVRRMLVDLFDESRDLWERIDAFKREADDMREETKAWSESQGKSYMHYQDENSITTYLWLRYPNAHYIYKYGVARSLSQQLSTGRTIKKGAYAANVRNNEATYGELHERIAVDPDLRGILDKYLDENCDQDEALHTLASDFGYYVFRSMRDHGGVPGTGSGLEKTTTDEWWPTAAEYDPGITAAKWLELLGDKGVFDDDSLAVMRAFVDIGGTATCTQLAEKYGRAWQYYNTQSVALAKRVRNATGCPTLEGDENVRWWPVLYIGRHAATEEQGSYVWRLRDELAEALAQHLDGDAMESNLVLKQETIRRLMLELFSDRHERGNLDAIAFVRDSGEISDEGLAVMEEAVPLYESRTRSVVHLLWHDEKLLDKLGEDAFRINDDGVAECRRLGILPEAYGRADFLDDVYMSADRYDRLRGVLMCKKNLILQGAPGVGKTFCARRLAWSIMGERDDSRIEMVQFHQSYTYEDFIMGYKPEGEGFALKEGVFYRFCKRAEADPSRRPYFFIIDEINRGNLSKVLGELMMLIERDYRGRELTLAYRDERFSVPENVYIIGMMNTADRSLALIDYALRRRFAFFEMRPGFDSERFQAYKESLSSDALDLLVGQLQALNAEIRHDPTLGKGFEIGHSHLCGQTAESVDDEWLREVVDFDILPTLEEYWFDDEEKVDRWTAALRGVFQ